MNARRYLKPGWMQRKVGNALAPLVRPALVWKLTVPARRSGRERVVPVAVLEHDGDRYLVSVYGASDWALDLRSAGQARLSRRGHEEHVGVVEVAVADRAPVIAAYQARYGNMPHAAAAFRALPDAADHPTFRIVAAPA